MTLWRLRVHVPDEPGRLAGLAAALASRGGNILAVAVHACEESCVVDELIVDLPADVRGPELIAVTTAAGCADLHLTRTQPTALVDETTRALHLAATVRDAPHRVVEVLGALLEADTAEAAAADEAVPAPGPARRRGHSLALANPVGPGAIVLRRAWAPFTVTEVARAQAMLQLVGVMLADAAPAAGPVGAPPTGAGPGR